MRKILFQCFTVLLLAFNGFASAEIKTVVVEAQGSGATFEEARTAALQDAIMQVTGVTLDAKTVQTIASQTHSADNGKETVETNENRTTFQQQIREKLKGYVQSYSVLDQKELPGPKVRVLLSVSIAKFEMAGMENSRRSISVQAFASENGTCFKSSVDSDRISEAAVDAVQTALTSTRKFSVLDRDGSAYLAEREFLMKNPDVRPQELARIGHLQGADYVVSGKVRNLVIGETRAKSSLSDAVFVDRYARADVLFNVMAFATGQVQLSSSVKINLTQGLAGKTCGEILTNVMNEAAKRIAAQTLETIFPPMVVRIAGENLYVNYGAPNIVEGRSYKLFAPGEIVYDPYTKEQLGRAEILIGEVEAVDVKPKYSVVRLKNPELLDKVHPGAIVRPITQKKAKAKPKVRKAVSDDDW